MAKAMWRGKVLAESERFELVEGNVYFPPDTLDRRFVKPSPLPLEGHGALLHGGCRWGRE